VPAPLEVSILNTNYTAGLIIRVSFRKVHYNSKSVGVAQREEWIRCKDGNCDLKWLLEQERL